jgi:hypothetical protein
MGVFQGNAGTPPNSSVFTSDIGSVTRLATSAPFQRYLQEEIWERSAFVRSGIMQNSAVLNNVTGVRVEVPFFDPLNYTEEIVRSSNDWGLNNSGFYQTQKTTASTQFATICTRGAAFAADDLSRFETGEDALSNIRSQLARDMDRKATAKLISMLTGILGPGGVLAATNSLDVSVTAAPTEVNYLSASTVTAAKYLLGERANSLTVIAMHPKVAASLEVLGMLTFSTDSLVAGGNIAWGGGGLGVTSTQLGYFAGMRVVIDEQLPVRGAQGEAEQFVNYIFSPGAILTGAQFPMLIENERNILSLQDILAVTYSSVHHLPGVSWAASFDNPDNSQLATPGSWSLAYSEPRLCPVVELVTNSSFGGLVP